MLRANGSKVQVYHVADGLSKGMRICRNQSSFQDHEHGGLPTTKCRKRITREDTGYGTNLWRVSPVLSKGKS